MGTRSRSRRPLGLVAVAVAAVLVAASQIGAAQGEFANTKELGRAVAQYNDNALQIVIAYNYSQRQHGIRWILVQMAVRSTRPTTIRRGGIFVSTPDGRIIDLATQRRFREESQRVNALLLNSSTQRHAIGSYFLGGGLDPTEDIGFFASPFGGLVHDEFETRVDRVMTSDLFFENPRGLWDDGVYALTVQSDRIKAELPLLLNK